MSHFTVLVVTDTPEQVESALQPFHEYECTGINDEYVVFCPAEESMDEMKSTHERHKKEYQDSTPADFDEFVSECYGYENRDGVYGRETNPNAKWDWWLVGGRWSGMLRLKEGATGASGRLPLIMGGGVSDGIDQARKGDIDFDTPMNEAGEKAAILWDAVNNVAPDGWMTWEMVRKDEQDISKASVTYHKQPSLISAKEAIKQVKNTDDLFFFEFDELLTDRASYVEKKRKEAIGTFAVLVDGKWLEKGDMGWWACVSNENENWADDFIGILDRIPDDKLLTVVDCHI